MAVDLATLGLEIKAQSVDEAKKSLQDFKKEAKETEAAAVSVGEKGSAALDKLGKSSEKLAAVTIKMDTARGGKWEWNDRMARNTEREAAANAKATSISNARAAALAREATAAKAAEMAIRQKRMADLQAGIGAALDNGLANASGLGGMLGGAGMATAALTGGVGALSVVAGVLVSELIAWGMQAVIAATKTKTLAEATDEHAEAVTALAKGYQIAEGALENFGKKSDLVTAALERQKRLQLDLAIEREEQKFLGGLSGSGGPLAEMGWASNLAGYEFEKLQPAIEKLRREMIAGKGDYDAFQKSIQAVADTDPGLQKKVDELLVLTSAAALATGQYNQLNSAMGALGSGKGGRLGGTSASAMDDAQAAFDERMKLSTRLGIPGLSRNGLSDEQKKAFRDSQRETESAAKAYRDLIKTAQDRITQMQLEAETAGQVGVKAERLRFELDLVNKAQDKGRQISPKQREEIEKLGDEYERLAERVARAQLQTELLFERDQLMRSGVDQRIASELRGAGLPIDFNSYEASLIRTNELMREGKELIGGFFQDLAGGLESGLSLWDAFAEAGVNALSRIADKMIQMATDQLIANIFGAIFGGVGGGLGGGMNGFGETVAGGVSGIFDTGFESGGYTGGRRGRAAGIVHGEEFVVNADATRRNRGALEAMNSNQPFSAGGGGGFINAPQFAIDARGAQQGVAEQIAKALENWDKGSVQRLFRDFPELRRRAGAV